MSREQTGEFMVFSTLALVWAPGDALEYHTQDGWSHKLLWVIATHVQGAVTIHGMNLRTGTPV